MRILYFSGHPTLNLASDTGYGTHMREVIASFERKGHVVLPLIIGGTEKVHNANRDVVPPPSLPKIIAKTLIPKYFWESLKDNRLIKSDLAAFDKLSKAIEEFQPDLIYERGYYLLEAGVKAAKKYGVKHYLEINAPYTEEKVDFSGKSMYHKKAIVNEQLQLETCDKLVVVSTALAEHFKSRRNGKPIVVTPNAINLDRIKVDEKEANQIKEHYGFGDGDLIVGFVGSIFPYHGVQNLIEAFKICSLNNSNLRLLIVGDGEILNSLINSVKGSGFEDRLVFTGGVDHDKVFSHISIMDITVMARSNWYGSPVKIFEYGILGKAIIAPDNVPVRDVMINNEDGILVDESDEALIKALAKMISDPQTRQRMGESFKYKIEQNYTWDNVTKLILD